MWAALFLSCESEAPDPPDLSALEARVAALEEQLGAQGDSGLEGRVEAIEEQLGALPAPYTDEDAVAAVQNSDPWSDPDRANLLHLWSSTDYGYQWLESSRWTMDNRADPPGAKPRHELLQGFHETPECEETSAWADCDATGGIKLYVNGPRITDNDWSEEGFAAAAARRYHTHTSGLYLVSFGQYSTVTDYAYGLIPPSGIHLEPHGAHQALRIDGSQNSGDNVRIETTPGSTGLAIYESDSPASTCEELRGDCEVSYPLYLRGGRVHLEELSFERSLIDARDAGTATLHTTSLGIEHFYSWHIDPELGVPVHCTWNTRASPASIARIQPYSASPDLLQAHTYVVVAVWGPGEAPAECLGTQLIKTDASGVYGYLFDSALTGEGGFSVALLGADPEIPLDPGSWQESRRPAFLYELTDSL